jgi:PAS domain S-box-containing protein
VKDDSGQTVAGSVIVRDVTEFRRAAQVLRASAHRYRLLFDENPVCMWIYDRGTLRFLDVNQAAINHYGYSREEFLTMSIEDIRPREDIPRLHNDLAAQGEEGQSLWRHRKKDGTVIDVEVLAQPFLLDDPSTRLVIVKDVTERTKVERDLRKALEAEKAATARLRAVDDMKNTFLTAVSHELRTPLTAVVGSAFTLQRLGLDLQKSDQKDLLEAIITNAVKLQAMLGDLLDLDRLTRGVLPLRRRSEELGGLVRTVVDDSGLADTRTVHVDMGQMVFPVDGPMVQRIVENLLANAAKYSAPGTPIWVSAKRIPEGSSSA